jgi:hypothetical protein
MEDNLSELIEHANTAVKEYRNLGLPKSKPIGRLIADFAEEAGMYPVPNIAVEVCLQIYTSTMKEEIEKGTKAAVVERLARLAYAASLPKLTNADCIRDFIACVVHGMGIGAIPSSEGTRLLYGAQIAHSALPGGKKRHAKRTENTAKTSSVVTPTPSPSTP